MNELINNESVFNYSSFNLVFDLAARSKRTNSLMARWLSFIWFCFVFVFWFGIHLVASERDFIVATISTIKACNYWHFEDRFWCRDSACFAQYETKKSKNNIEAQSEQKFPIIANAWFNFPHQNAFVWRRDHYELQFFVKKSERTGRTTADLKEYSFAWCAFRSVYTLRWAWH